MYTENCLYCDKAFEKMQGKLLIQVKVPEDAMPLSKVYIFDKTGFFNISLVPGSVFIFDVEDAMEICANYSLGKYENSPEVKIEPGEFTHLVVDYEYFYCRNQARVKKIKLQKIEHKNTEDLYE